MPQQEQLYPDALREETYGFVERTRRRLSGRFSRSLLMFLNGILKSLAPRAHPSLTHRS